MKLTQTLLGYLNRVFNKEPQGFVALGFTYAGSDMTWTVAERVLTVTVTGGVGAGFTANLPDYTLVSLAAYIAGRTGFTVNTLAATPLSTLSAAVLLDASGRQSAGTTRLLGYTSILYAWMETAAVALTQAQNDVIAALQQISIYDGDNNPSAAGVWLDEIGGYFGIPRTTAEPDVAYGPRIVAEVLRAKGNNVGMEAAIKFYTGQTTSVVDVPALNYVAPLYDGTIVYDGAHTHNATGSIQYNLFDITVGYDIVNGGSPTAFQQTVKDIIERLRDAGTHLRALSLTGSQLSDTMTSPPTDGMTSLIASSALGDTMTGPTDSSSYSFAAAPALSDTLTAPSEGSSADVTYTTTHNGARSYNSRIQHYGGHTTHGPLDGTVNSVT